MNCGNTSKAFAPCRGLRQGCCASPHIFLLVAELLSHLIRNNSSIRGIRMGESEAKLAQFADDLTCMLSDEESLSVLMSTLKKFESWSGLRINRNKTKIISPKRIAEGSSTFEGIEVCDKAKILGIWIGTDATEESSYRWNFKGPLEKIQQVCDSWHNRSLSIKGKITVVNSLMVSVLQYPCSIIYTPERVLKEYKRITSAFIWNDRKPRISHQTLTQPIELGGLKLMDLGVRVKVNLLQWIKRLLLNPLTNVRATLSWFLETDDIDTFLSYRSPPLPKSWQKHTFYYHMMRIYLKARDVGPSDESSVRREVLWYNDQIGGSKAPIYWPSWDKAGIKTIGDLCHPSEGRLLSHVELQDTYNIRCSFLEALSIRLNVPSGWRNLISTNWIQMPQHGPDIHISLNKEGPQNIAVFSAKKMYQSLVSKDSISNAAFHKWSVGVDGIKITSEQEWQEICTNTFGASRETKLQSLQYKLLNRIIPCGVHLKQLRIQENDECRYCNGKDTTVHFFYKCHLVQAFWHGVCGWFRRGVNLYLDRLTPKEFLFGLPKSCYQSRIINTILINIRFYVFRQKLFHQSELSLTHWLREFKGKLTMEKWICTRLGKPNHFAHWRDVLMELG